MKDLITFINQFFSNKGFFVFLSLLVSKLTQFITVVFVIKLISEDDFGRITLIASVLSFFTPINGFGSAQGLMKFGTSLENAEDKNNLSRYMFWKGFRNQILVTLIFILFCSVYGIKYQDLSIIILFFSIRLVGFFFLGHLQVDYRMHNDNFSLSMMTMMVNCIGLIIAFVMTYYYGAIGYLISMAISPFLSCIYLKNKHWNGIRQIHKSINGKFLWSFSLLESLAYLASEILFSIDIILIALFLAEKDIALYKVAIILPMNLIFLPNIFLHTDFSKIVSNHLNKSYLKFYLLNYLKLFIPGGIVMLILGYIFKDQILGFVFKAEYANGGWAFFIALCGVVSAMWMKVLFTYMLSAVGKAVWNVYVSISALIVLVVLAFIFIPNYGIEGAAFSMAMALFLSGICSSVFFLNHFRKLA